MDAIGPVFAVGLAAGSCQILLIVGNQFIELGARLRDVFRPRDLSVVAVENLVHHGQCRVSIERYVMCAHVPENTVVGDAEKCANDEKV